MSELKNFKPCIDFDPIRMTKCFICDKAPIDTNSFGQPVCLDHMYGAKKLAWLNYIVAELREQLNIATDLGEKRWKVLNEIYEQAEKRNTNWCKRKAEEGLMR